MRNSAYIKLHQGGKELNAPQKIQIPWGKTFFLELSGLFLLPQAEKNP
jgi:hypothetical protein